MNILKKKGKRRRAEGEVVCGDVRKSSTATRPFFWVRYVDHKLRTANAALACGY